MAVRRATDEGITAQAVLDGIPDSAVLLDGRGRITAVNRAWTDFCVKNGGDVAAVTPPADYIAACTNAKPATTAREVVDGITSVLNRALDRFDFEYPCHGPDIERWFRMTVTAVPEGVLVMHHDISSEYARVGRWLASTSLVVLELDPQANAVYVNAAWAALARRPTRHLLGAHWADHLEPDQVEVLLDAVRDAGETGRGATVEVRVPGHDRHVHLRFTVDPYIDVHGVLRRITLIGAEVSGTGPGVSPTPRPTPA